MKKKNQVNIEIFSKKNLGRKKKSYHQHAELAELSFIYMDIIRGKLFSNHPKNLNHVHKDSKDFVSVIITAGKNIRGGDTVFYDGVKISDLGSGAHVLQYLYKRMIFSPFEKKSMKVLFGEDIEQ